ncbi:MAG: hypothetical protein FNP40_01410 [Dehalobacter sp. 4CP]|uniref:hypothetical protein n=1 Tax=Dehalobacter sp. CP TaxID=2594474 RepID=UPI0013C7DB18|nr:hypothetical protein [Dehalobacter sp. 4CP]
MGTLVRRPVVENVFNTRLAQSIFIDLTEKTGGLAKLNMITNHDFYTRIDESFPPGLSGEYALDPGKKYSYEEIIERKICSHYGPEALEEFEKCAFKPFRLPLKQSYNYWYVPENSIRLPLYYERMARNGKKLLAQLAEFKATLPGQDMKQVEAHYSALPNWYQSPSWETTKEFPFKVVNWKIHYGPNNTGRMYENAYMQETMDYSNPFLKCIWVAESVAEEMGLKEWDTVIVESAVGGKIKGKIHLSQFIHPKCIGIPGNFGRRTPYMNPVNNTGVHFNSLLSVDESTLNPISLSLESSPQVKFYKA